MHTQQFWALLVPAKNPIKLWHCIVTCRLFSVQNLEPCEKFTHIFITGMVPPMVTSANTSSPCSSSFSLQGLQVTTVAKKSPWHFSELLFSDQFSSAAKKRSCNISPGDPLCYSCRWTSIPLCQPCIPTTLSHSISHLFSTLPLPKFVHRQVWQQIFLYLWSMFIASWDSEVESGHINQPYRSTQDRKVLH